MDIKKSSLQAFLAAILLFVGILPTSAKTVNINGINYELNDADMTAEVARNSDAMGNSPLSGDIVLPATLSYDGKSYTLTAIGQDGFHDCDKVTSVSIPSTVTAIKDDAFYYCKSITSLIIPQSVTTIGECAFFGCENLTSLTIPAGVTSIGEEIFAECYALGSIVVEGGNKVYDSRNGCNAIIETASNTLVAACKNTVIPTTVTTIGNCGFYKCKVLTSVVIPANVTAINEYGFYRCESLKDVYCYGTKMKTAGEDAFQRILPGATLHVHASLVDSYKSATDWQGWFGNIVALAEEVKTDGATYRVDVESSNTVELSSPSATSGSVTLPDTIVADGAEYTVTSIGDRAFEGCANLTSVTIPASITQIGDMAFSGCSALADVYCYGETVKEAQDNSFDTFGSSSSARRATAGGIADATLHVPAALIDTYRATAPWSSFGHIVALTGGDASGIGSICIDASETYHIFSADGKQLPALQKGLNILRTDDGRSIKVMR